MLVASKETYINFIILKNSILKKLEASIKDELDFKNWTLKVY